MSDRTFGLKKAGTSTFSNPSLVSPHTPTLANPVRGFGLPTNNIIQTKTSESTNQQEAQVANEQSLLSEVIHQRSFGHDISRMALRRPQAKLTVGEPGDKYEQEADWMANQVMRMVVPDKLNAQSQEPVEDSLQRKCAACEQEEDKVQTKPSIQTATDGGLQAGNNIESRLNSTKGGGSALPDEVRSFMEPRFGHDFARVRVHNDSVAVQMNRELGAQAFTHGSDVYFGAGKLPGNNELTAHELTHVVQQTGADQTDTLEKNDTLQKKENYPEISSVSTHLLQRAPETDSASQDESVTPPISWASGPLFGSPIELPADEAARRVNQALDIIGPGLTYIRRPPTSPDNVAAADDTSQPPSATNPNLQAFSDIIIQRDVQNSSFLAKVHGGFVGSIQICWDCLTGNASLKGWVWAGVGYEAPVIGWIGGYYFGEKTWWKGDLGKWFEPGTCAADCDSNEGAKSESGFGIAGFPINIKPKQRASFSKAGLEGGFLLTPHSFCEADIELIALLNILNYLGPIASVVTKAVDGINAVTKDQPHVTLEAGIDASATFHLCRGKDSLLTVNRANFCGGGFVGGGIGLSHSKEENHGAI